MTLPILHADIERYLEQLAEPRSPVLAEMEEQGRREGFPIVGPLVGRLLSLCARTIGARHAFELGSGFGYSAHWLAEAMGPEGRIVLTDGSAARLKQAGDYLQRAGLDARVSYEVGDAKEALERHGGPFDLIFCDIDKEQYPEVPPLALPRLRPGGLLIFDNTLWSGRVAEPGGDAATRAVKELNRSLHSRSDLLTVVVPLRDGVSVSLKLAHTD